MNTENLQALKTHLESEAKGEGAKAEEAETEGLTCSDVFVFLLH